MKASYMQRGVGDRLHAVGQMLSPLGWNVSLDQPRFGIMALLAHILTAQICHRYWLFYRAALVAHKDMISRS